MQKSRLAYIYLITNKIDGRRYVGQHDGSKPHYFGSGSYLQRAVMKHGREAFNREILCSGKFDKELLDFLECEAIEKYKTYIYDNPDLGYNLDLGGSSPKGRKQSRDSVRKMVLNNPRRKTIYQFTTDAVMVSFYESCSEASRQTKIQCPSIIRCIHRKVQTAGGFLWSSKNKVKPLKIEPNVYCYDLNGNYLRSYQTMSEAAEKLNTVYTAISNAVKLKGMSSGFLWSTEKLEKIDKYEPEKGRARSSEKLSKAVNMYSMEGVFERQFKSIREAAKYLNTYTSNIANAINGRQSWAKGHKFRYADGFERTYKRTSKGKSCPIKIINCKVTGKPFVSHGKLVISKEGWEQRHIEGHRFAKYVLKRIWHTP